MKLTREQSRALFARIRRDGTEDLRDVDPDVLRIAQEQTKPRQAPVERKPKMNKTEARYEAEILRPMLHAGELVAYLFQPITLKVAEFNCRYTPDWFLVLPDRFAFHEVKGFWRDDALVKFKAAATQYPWFDWVSVQHKRGEWVTWDPWEDGCR